MKKTPGVIRTIWCETCYKEDGGSPQPHEITYHGTAYEKGKASAKFDALCQRCLARDPKTKPASHVVGIASYNALIGQEIYASSVAP